MVIGSQRLLLVLEVGAEKEQEIALNHESVRVVWMEVRSSWKGEDVSKVIEKVTEKMGRKPEYVVSDGCSNLRKGILDAGLVRICDVSHQIALFLEHHYGQNSDFIAWQKDLSQSKFKGIMRDLAYLLPPKQRTIARFMNLTPCVVWSKKMINSFSDLSESEQTFFGFIKDHQSFIHCFEKVLSLCNKVIELLKIKGLSHKSIAEAMLLISKGKKDISQKLMDDLMGYLRQEQAKLPDEKTVWHCCSNCIESLFGKLKQILPNNSLNGVSAQILALPLLTAKGLEGDIKQALETISLPVLQDWIDNNIPDNQIIRRRKILKN
jgi:hypothetical protein